MSSQYPVLNNKPIDQWKVTELREELRRRRISVKGLKEELVRKLDEALQNEKEIIKDQEVGNICNPGSELDDDGNQVQAENLTSDHTVNVADPSGKTDCDTATTDIDVNQDIMTTDIDVNQDIMTTDIDVNQDVMTTDIDVNQDVMTTDIDVNQDIKVQVAITATSGLEATDLETNSNVDSLEESATESQTRTIQHESSDLDLNSKEKHGEETHEDSNAPCEDIKLGLSESDNQVSVVSPGLGSQVKCDSIPIDSVSIIEKNKLKDNLNANDFHLEQEVVKPEMVQPSSSCVPSVGGDLQSLGDDKGQDKDLVSLEDADVKNSADFDLGKKEDNVDEESPEKLNLDRSSSDELMEEDVSERRQIESNIKSDKLGGKTEVKLQPAVGERTNIDSGLGGSIPYEKDTVDEDHRKSTVPTEKRKLEDREAVGNNEAPKRQRHWNSETVKVPEWQASNLSTSSTPKDAFQPTPRRTFTKSDSKPSGDSQKDRIVPPSQKSATTSLRINKFLRPFTLKAVEELLAKTGTVCSFWMDHIKTHCYVTYSSVEEAIATRNAVYNLQWPLNGGNLLVAEFVDPQEVKVRVEAPPQSTTPISSSPSGTKSTNFHKPQTAQPPARQLSLRQQSPPFPTPPALSDPPTVREQLPPPPPPPRKAEPPSLTLDDLFRKTKATPTIYYLPLREEEVASKACSTGQKR